VLRTVDRLMERSEKESHVANVETKAANRFEANIKCSISIIIKFILTEIFSCFLVFFLMKTINRY
jgi:hypothetical protein